MLIPWQEKYSVHVKEIDEQHQHFVGILNELYSAINQNNVREVMGHILDEVSGYGMYHFATEEKYFDMFNYPEAESHKAKHAEFRTTIKGLKDRFESKEEDVTAELVESMEGWLVQHILDFDKRYSDYFNAHGLY